MINLLLNVKNVIQHYCIQEGETHWSNTLPLKRPAFFHPAMDDSMT